MLSPLAFPENPYHRLVKDYKLVRDSLNDPLADARLAMALFHDQWAALQQQQAEDGLLDFYRYAFSGNPQFAGVQRALSAMGAKAVDASGAFDLFVSLTQSKAVGCAERSEAHQYANDALPSSAHPTVCSTAINQMANRFAPATALAYCLAWLRVAGGNSVLPPWVRLRFDDVAPTLNRLRDVPCNDPGCSYCAQMHDPVIWLERYFGFPGFRPEPPAADGGSLTLRHKGLDQYAVKLNRGWAALNATADIRQSVAKVVLDGIMQRIPEHTKASADVLVEFSAEDLLAALNRDLVTMAEVKDPLAAVERALNFLHEQKIITLQKGLAVFRQAMTIEVLPEAKGRQYNKGDFEPLSQHYSERIFQVHVINEYAKYGLDKISHALAFVVAYFSSDKTEFVKRYFSDRKDILERATSQQSFQRSYHCRVKPVDPARSG